MFLELITATYEMVFGINLRFTSVIISSVMVDVFVIRQRQVSAVQMEQRKPVHFPQVQFIEVLRPVDDFASRRSEKLKWQSSVVFAVTSSRSSGRDCRTHG